MVMCNQWWDNSDWQVVTSWRSQILLETGSGVAFVGRNVPVEAGGARSSRDEEPHDLDTRETRTDGKDHGREEAAEIVLVAGEFVLAADDVGSLQDDASYQVGQSQVDVLQDSWPEPVDSKLSLV